MSGAEENKTVKYLNRKTHEVFESSGDLDNKDYLLLPNDVETIVVDDGSIGLFKDGYCTYLYEDDVFRVWRRDNCGVDYYLEEYKSTKVIWSKGEDTTNYSETSVFNPLVPQEGGDHYKLRPIQPIEYSERNGLSMCQGNIVKYITRHKEKNKVEDLAKVVHYALLESYFVYGESGSTELKDKILKLLGWGK